MHNDSRGRSRQQDQVFRKWISVVGRPFAVIRLGCCIAYLEDYVALKMNATFRSSVYTPAIMKSHHNARVSFANPIIHSVSRGPTRLEFLYLNLFESHVERCSRCSPILEGYLPYRCTQGQALETLVLLSFWVARDGAIRSTQRECGHPVRVELSRAYKAAVALLWQEHWWRAKCRK